MSSAVYKWFKGEESRDVEWLTELLEQRTFNNVTSKHMLELYMSLPGMRSVQIYAATRKDNQLSLDLSHCSGDLSVECDQSTFQLMDTAFHQQNAFYGSAKHNFGLMPLSWNDEGQSGLDNCSHLFLPMRINNTCVGVVMLVIEVGFASKQPIKWLKLLTAILSQCLCSTLIPNFVTLYARPYQRIEKGELSQIQEVLGQCGGNKTMAAKVLSMTPRQLRYRLEKLQAEEGLSV